MGMASSRPLLPVQGTAKQMTIRTKIIAFQVFFVCLALLLAAIVYSAILRADYFIGRVFHAHRQLETITALSLHANRYFEQIAEMVLFGEAGRPDLEAARWDLERSFAELERVTHDEIRFVREDEERASEEQELALIEQMRAIDTRMDEVALELLQLQLEGRAEEARQRYRVEIEETLDDQLQELVDIAIADERAEVSRVDQETVALTRELSLIVGAAMLLAVGAGAGAVTLLSRAISRPIARLTEGAEAIGRGELGHRIAVDGRDELALLSGHFNRMAEQLEAQRRELLQQQTLLERKVNERTAELADTNRRLEEVNRRLKDLDRLRVLFLADISHELRTPLTVLRGEAEVTLRQSASRTEDYRETLERVVEQAEHMTRLVDDLLFLTRAEADSIRFEMGEVCLREVFEEALEQGRVLAGSGGPVLVADFPNEAVRVTGDRQRLKQTALIAIDNAVKYSHLGTTATVELRAEDGEAVVKVRNHGDPIPAEDLPYVFERFYRGRHARRLGGSGLGLFIAKWIVEKHGGRIALRSQPDGTTELEIRLRRETTVRAAALQSAASM